MDTKEIKINYKGSPAIVKIKKLSFGEKNEIYRRSTKIKLIGKEPITEQDPFLIKELAITKAVIEAPFKTDLANIRGLDAELGEKLFKEIDEFNTINEEKKENSSGEQSTEQTTQN